jgi:mannonate dehydratase
MSDQDTVADPDELPMRVGVRTHSIEAERMQFLKQMGVEDVFVDHAGLNDDPTTVSIETGQPPTVEELVAARRHVEDEGLRFAGIHTLDQHLYENIMFGWDGREEEIETIQQLLRNMGQADIPVLGYQWNAGPAQSRTSRSAPIRGGAGAEEYERSEAESPDELAPKLDRSYTEEEFWDNYEAFLEAVLPVAEEAGVRMAVHPTDPPTVESLSGIPQLFRNFENFKRGMELVPSDHHGLKLCLGCFSEMENADPIEVIRYFGERDEIVFVHFRDVIGTWPAFTETFIDDQESNFDAMNAMEALRDVGFDGVIIPDHVPSTVGDTDWGHRSRAHATAYLKGLIRCARTRR